MIIFELACTQGHRFEGWFASTDDYTQQRAADMVRCPLCDDAEVVKVPSARVHVGKAAPLPRPAPTAPAPAPVASRKMPAISGAPPEFIAQLRAMVRAADNVGTHFPEEARKIHYEEAPARSIRGQASPEEAEALREEGIDFSSLPSFLSEEEH